MKYFFLVILLFSLTFMKGQGNTPGLGITTNGGVIVAFDLYGKPIPPSNQMPVEGHPFLYDEFVTGKLTLRNGMKVNMDRLNLSLLDNHIHFKKDSVEYLFPVPLNEVILLSNQHGIEKPIYFKSGYPGINGNSTETLYLQVSEGSRLQLLKHQYKIIDEVYRYGMGGERKYLLKESLSTTYKTRPLSILVARRSIWKNLCRPILILSNHSHLKIK